MAFDDIATDEGGVAGRGAGRNAVPGLDGGDALDFTAKPWLRIARSTDGSSRRSDS